MPRTLEKSRIIDAQGREAIIARQTAQTPYARAYQNAGYGMRFAGMSQSSASATRLILGNAAVLRNRSRDAVRNNPWAFNGVESFAANAIGEGITPDSQHPDPSIRADLLELWKEFVKEADADGVTTFNGQCWQAASAMVESGECFIRYRLRRLSDGLAVPLQLQILEPDFVPLAETGRMANGDIIRGGIGFNLLGQRTLYRMYAFHPGDTFFSTQTTQQLSSVPASRVAHVFVARRPGQIRGEPWLARTLLRLNNLDEYDDASLLQQKIAAMFGAYIKVPDAFQSVEILSGQEATVPDEQFNVTLEPGTAQYLRPGEEVDFSDPPDPGTGADDFLRYQLRGIAAGQGVTYEQLTGDLSGVNFSSIRAGLTEMRRRLSVYVQHWIVHQLCQRTWNVFLREAAVGGMLPGRMQYFANPRPFKAVRWIPQGFEFVNPNQEAEALMKIARAGFASRSEIVTKRGRTPDELDNEIAEDNARADARGLVFTSDPRHGVTK